MCINLQNMWETTLFSGKIYTEGLGCFFNFVWIGRIQFQDLLWYQNALVRLSKEHRTFQQLIFDQISCIGRQNSPNRTSCFILESIFMEGLPWKLRTSFKCVGLIGSPLLQEVVGGGISLHVKVNVPQILPHGKRGGRQKYKLNIFCIFFTC